MTAHQKPTTPPTLEEAIEILSDYKVWKAIKLLVQAGLEIKRNRLNGYRFVAVRLPGERLPGEQPAAAEPTRPRRKQ